MARTLDVYLHRNLAGHLQQDDHGLMVFEYASEWLLNPKAVPLSHSLPLREERFRAKECRGFFGGILPEADQRKTVAKNLGISARNDFSMLEQIGGECAGAVTFVPQGEALPPENDHYHPLSDHDLAELLRELPSRPLLAGTADVRLSLAGAQNKVALHIANDAVSIPLDGAPSTHILKPAIPHFDGLVFNEAFCMRLAEAVGIPTARTSAKRIEGIDYLLVERYDRLPAPDNTVTRLHQEDFCQALAVPSEQKYQNEGGPSIAQCVALLRAASSVPVIDLGLFLDATVFNFLIGNNDAHGKNFSLLYHPTGTRLAPLYDVLSTAYYPELSTKMAMKIGGEYQSKKVFSRHFERLAEEAGLGKALVEERVSTLALGTLTALDTIQLESMVDTMLSAMIGQRCQMVLRQFRA